MMQNRLKRKMLANEPTLGTFFHMGSANAAECLGCTGLDYIIIDLEHCMFSPETACDFMRAAELHGITALARVSDISRPSILRLLDIGAGGLIIPCVRTMDEIKRIVEYAKFAPVGMRGFSTSRRDTWGFSYPTGVPIEENMRINNEETLVIPQCETVSCLEQIEEITAVDGIDGIFIGPFDLSISMGIPGQFDHPRFLEAIARILAACKQNNKFSIVFTANRDAIPGYFKQGFDSVTYNLDTAIYIQAWQDIVKQAMSE